MAILVCAIEVMTTTIIPSVLMSNDNSNNTSDSIKTTISLTLISHSYYYI
jgi:hypothetical protein